MEEANMTILHKQTTVCDRSAINSLTIGVLGAILTGYMHYRIMTSSHFDFLIRDAEVFLTLGAILLVFALSVVDLRAGLYTIRHLNEPHSKYAKPVALSGITLGIAELLPAAIILMILIETLALKFITIKNIFKF
jgi:hypothetical protein